jgi:hypothetical protein
MRVLVAAALLFLVACTPPSSSASPTPTESLTASPNPQASATRVPNATAGPATYISLEFAYRLELPAGWRHSQCQSGEDIGGTVASRHEGFTPASVDDEAWGHTGPTQAVVSVVIQDNPRGRTALQWLSDGGLGFGNTFDRATVDGRDGAQVISSSREVTTLITAARGRIYAISGFGPQGITPDAQRVMNSLHVLDDAELASARATITTPAPTSPRSAEIVADTVARGFSQKDVGVLATVAWACLTQGLQQSGASGSSATRALDELRKAFAAGLTVTLAPRPVIVPAGGYSGIEGTWTEAGRAPRHVAINFLKRGDTWYWFGWILGA